MEKLPYLRAMWEGWKDCHACGLCQDRTQIVFGQGNLDAQVMIIGEAPGENEDRQGVPFIGQAGQILHQFLGDVSARREVIDAYLAVSAKNSSPGDIKKARADLHGLLLEEFYFTNIVMCRPPDNRDPIPKEMEACRSRLLEQIYTVDPVVIVAAGRIAAQALLSKNASITAIHGQIFDVEFKGRAVTYRYPMMAILHPSYIMRRNDFRQKGGEAAQTRDNLLRVMQIVDEYNLRHYGIEKPRLRPEPLNKRR
jgi:uracil-DNA glycosylase